MALSGWSSDKKITISIPGQAEELTDFPVQVNLTTASGTTDFDCSEVFAELSPFVDTHWSDVVLAMPMDGVNGSTSFNDLKGKTVTVYGHTRISTTQSKFGGTSAYFDGNGDYLTVPSSTDFNFGTGDFTVECWIYLSSVSVSSRIFDFGSNGATLVIYSGGKIGYYNDSVGGSGSLYTEGPVLSTNTWYHIAIVRSEGITAVYVDGTIGMSQLDEYSYPSAILNIGRSGGGGQYLSGYIDDFRITKSVARYTTNFTPLTYSISKTDPLYQPKNLAVEYGDTGQQCFVEVERWDAANKSAQLWCRVPILPTAGATLNLYYDATKPDNNETADPHWSSVVLAMPMDGANNSTTFTDLKGKTVTRYGDTKISTLQSKFGGTSAYFDGNGDYLTVPNSADFDFGTGDFTIEMWVRFNAALGTATVSMVSNRANASTGWTLQCRGDLGTIRWVLGDSVIAAPAWTPSGSTWYHLAVARSGTSLRIFIDGVQIGTTVTDSSNYTSTAVMTIGKIALLTSQYLPGNIDDLRITKGVARYTANFTPPDRSFINYVGGIGSHQGRQVWDSNYAAVYHLSQDPATTVKDSTWNNRNLTPYGSMTTAQLTNGPTGKALAMDGSNDYLAATATNLSSLQTAMTTEVVARFISESNDARLLTIGSETTGQVFLKRSGSSAVLNAGVWGDDAASGVGIDGAVYKHYGHRLAGGTIQAVGNGAIDAATNSVTVQSLSAAAITFAKLSTTYYQHNVRSARISSVARSAAWLAAAYNNDFDQLVTISGIVPGNGVVIAPVESVEGTATTPAVCWGEVEPPIDGVASEGTSLVVSGSVVQPLDVVAGTGTSEAPGIPADGAVAPPLEVISATADMEFRVGKITAPYESISATATTDIAGWGHVVPKTHRLSASGVSGQPVSSGQISTLKEKVTGTGSTVNVAFGDVADLRPAITATATAVLTSTGSGLVVPPRTEVHGQASPALIGGGSIAGKMPIIVASGTVGVFSTGVIAEYPHRVTGRFSAGAWSGVLHFNRDQVSASQAAPPPTTPLSFSR